MPQLSHFSWLVASDGERLMINPVNDAYRYFEQCSAYLASELGEMLPNYDEWVTASTSDNPPEGDSDGIKINHYKIGKYWYSEIDSETYVDGFDFYELKPFRADTEANARAKMLIYFLENHLISVEELGK